MTDRHTAALLLLLLLAVLVAAEVEKHRMAKGKGSKGKR
jgi:hypothetical protein